MHSASLLLTQGVNAWNQWRWENPHVALDLSGFDLSGLNLSGVNLGSANLRDAIFNGTNLGGSNLSATCMHDTQLLGADLSRASLYRADLYRANLQGANLAGADCRAASLMAANLRAADLNAAALTGANLRGANLREANLTEASLLAVQALGTDFSGATLTGCCLEAWQIGATTNLTDLTCDYIYLKGDRHERRPTNAGERFRPGELACLLQELFITVDLDFPDGIDWLVFVGVYDRLQQHYCETPLTLRCIENCGAGAVFVRIGAPADADKTRIEREFWQDYTARCESSNVGQSTAGVSPLDRLMTMVARTEGDRKWGLWDRE